MTCCTDSIRASCCCIVNPVIALDVILLNCLACSLVNSCLVPSVSSNVSIKGKKPNADNSAISCPVRFKSCNSVIREVSIDIPNSVLPSDVSIIVIPLLIVFFLILDLAVLEVCSATPVSSCSDISLKY